VILLKIRRGNKGKNVPDSTWIHTLSYNCREVQNIIQSGPEYNIWNEGSRILIRSPRSCGIYKGTERDPGETQTETVVLQVGENRLYSV